MRAIREKRGCYFVLLFSSKYTENLLFLKTFERIYLSVLNNRDVDMSAIGTSTLLVLVILTSILVELLCDVF